MQLEGQYWEGIIKNLNPVESGYDGWLDKYNLELFDSRQFIVELGCGWGNESYPEGDEKSFKTGWHAPLQGEFG